MNTEPTIGTVRVLHLEDDADFSELVKSMLEGADLKVDLKIVSDRASFETALASEPFGLVLADYKLPDYNGLEALAFVRARCADVPFLLVSGTVGEEAAIASLTSGATDYVLKLWPERLVPAVRRALQEAEEKRQRRRAECELLRRERHFRALTEHSLDILTLLDRDGIYLYNSASLTRALGYEPTALAGKEVFSFIHPEDLPTVREAFRFSLGHPGEPVRIEFRFRHADGSWRCLEAVGQNRLEDPDIGGIAVNSRDVTERKLLESQLRQSQKMEAIGQLAGGVAHDFNNILTVIHGHASLLQSTAVEPSRSARQILQAADRAATLTRQLLTFSRRQFMQVRLLDLNQVVADMSCMLGRLLGEDIALQLHYSAEPAPVRADPGMVEQVLLNLAVNARDAMPSGGVLGIKLTPRSLSSPVPGGHPESTKGEFICLSVTDTGCGISPENLRHIFEPFFTTKEVGKGTGLGLATVYGIVKQHGGWIEVSSQPGQGACFEVFLPAQSRAAAPSEKPGPQSVRGGSETILVVEDEAPVREVVCALLTAYGYRVIEARSGAQALQLWRQSHPEIDLLLTDLVMPDRVSGRDLAESLMAERPGLKVIFTSGYSAEVLGKDFVLQPGSGYLQKPYRPDKLAQAVRDSLDATNEPAANARLLA